MIPAENLDQALRPALAVDDVSFTCEPGTITGFLGPNGAGKSTTLRMLTGLTPPSSGRVTIDGKPYADLPNPGRLSASCSTPPRSTPAAPAWRRCGSPRDSSASRRAAPTRCSSGSASAAPGKRRVGNYSLGMRQRLGIGSALLGDPAVLVLDEPANGMDPEGIRWMRGLLQDFAARGGTVLLSSHLLGEVQATVDRLVVIGGGRIVANGSLQELLAGRARSSAASTRRPGPGAARRRAGPRAAARRRAAGRRHCRAGRPGRRGRRPGAARTA